MGVPSRVVPPAAPRPQGGRAVGVKDVARAAGVSVGTVSNVLNRPGIVAEATRERVLRVIDELGFVRNESARALRTGSSRAVGLVVIDAANPFFTDVARGVEDLVSELGGVVLLGNSAGDMARERRYLELFEQQRVRGVIIAPSHDRPPPLNGLDRLGIPVVFLDHLPGSGSYSSVTVDDVRGGELAVEHLRDQGHRRIAFAAGPMTVPQVQDRLRGARRAVAASGPGVGGDAAAGLSVLELDDLTTDTGRAAAGRLLGMPEDERPTAVFAGNDLVAIGLLQGVLQHGLRVPEDVAIVGYDDIEFAAAASVPLSSVRQPRHQLGRKSAELLMDHVAGAERGSPVAATAVRFTPELVVRRSSRRRPYDA
ncbi:MAG: LacI family DNA-binding transcriptional regulator [Kineosporiaceae bacterium]